MHKMEQNPSLNILDGMYVCDILGLVLPMVAWCVLSIPLCCCCPCTMCLLCCKPTWIKKYCSGASAIVQKLSLSLSILTWPVTVGLTVALLYFNFTLDSSQWFMLVSVDFQSHQLDNSLCTYALSECNQYYSVMEPTLLSSQPLNITARDCVSDQEYFTSVSASLHHSLTVGIPALLLTTLQLSLAMFLYRRRRVITGPGYVQLTELPTIISRAPPDATDLH
ncbi:hypothetical protein Pelo_10905 [Pelomyxa schiedti]|nr:hypothetical protein Pelo_10905 [Pelomyxa schiedti]